MVLVIDVGNSNIVLGVYEGDKLLYYWRAATVRNKSEDEYGMLLKSYLQDAGLSLQQVGGAIISSVVPPLLMPLELMCRKYLGVDPLIVGPGLRTGLNVRTENPREVGADRIVNAVAAIQEYGGPLVIVDFGTATTFCAVNRRGEYLGGAIAPGVGISTEALYARTAQLPRVEFINPGRVIGRNTVASMQAGILFGFVGQVDGIVQRMKEELTTDGKVTVVATGGLAEYIFPESESIEIVDPMLTLKGLHLIYQRNAQ